MLIFHWWHPTSDMEVGTGYCFNTGPMLRMLSCHCLFCSVPAVGHFYKPNPDFTLCYTLYLYMNNIDYHPLNYQV